jgi:YegS/Rv2252/BmrU family lipid kinase
MTERSVVVVNPRSNLGKTGKQLAGLCALLDASLTHYELLLTRAPGHARELTLAALARGARYVVACGGDGTLSEVVDAVMVSGHSASIAVSLLPLGTGRDFARSLGHSDAGTEHMLDVAVAHFRDAGGNERMRHVLNVASAGLSAESVRWVDAQAQRGRRHRLSYVLSAFAGLKHYTVSDVDVAIDGALLQRGPLCFCAVANGRFFGGGMPVAPNAQLDDGLLEVVAVAALPLWETLPFFARLLRGTHGAHRRTHVGRGRVVSLESSAPVWLEIDGEPVGTLPARISVLPAALKLRALRLAPSGRRASPR